MQNEYDVILVIDAFDATHKEKFDKHLKKEGFDVVDTDEFAYTAKAHLPLMNTRAFIFDVLKKAFEKICIEKSHFIFQLGDNGFERYEFSNADFTPTS